MKHIYIVEYYDETTNTIEIYSHAFSNHEKALEVLKNRDGKVIKLAVVE